MAILSDEAKKLGINLGYDTKTKNVTVGDKTYTPDQLKSAGLSLTNGRWQGDTTSLLNPSPQVVPAQQMVSSVAPAYQAPDYSSYVNSLAEQTKAKNVADLQRAYEKSIGSLNQEQATIAPKFEQGRSDTRRLAINQAKDFENFLATKGISASGTAGQGMIQQQGQLLGAIGQSKTAESNAQADIERRRSGLTTDLQYGISSAQAAADIEAARQLMELQQQSDTRKYNESQTASDRAYEESQTAKDIAREDAKTAEERARQDFIDNIGAYFKDYSKKINEVRNDGDTSNDWQIPFLEQAKQQKISDNNLDPNTGKALPVDNTSQIWDAAYKKWNAGIPLTQQEMQVIGATTSTKPKAPSSSGNGSKTTITQDRNYQDDRWQRLGKADEAIAQAWGVPVGTPYSNKPVESVDTSEYDDYINTYYRTSADGASSVDKNGIALYLVQLDKSGKGHEALELAIKYGISDETIELAERIYGNKR